MQGKDYIPVNLSRATFSHSLVNTICESSIICRLICTSDNHKSTIARTRYIVEDKENHEEATRKLADNFILV